MNQAASLAAALALGMTLEARGGQVQEGSRDLSRLAAALKLTASGGVGAWLERLGDGRGDQKAERLLAVSLTGIVVMEREGDASSVRVDPEMDRLLHDSSPPIVLIHNHPANVGLSAADLRQLAKRGVAAIVAIAHDGSVFMAARGPRMDADFFEERQHAHATAQVLDRLRIEWPSRSVSVEESTGLFSHLVGMALARAGMIQYWFRLRGTARESYERSRMVFSRVVVSASGRLK